MLEKQSLSLEHYHESGEDWIDSIGGGVHFECIFMEKLTEIISPAVLEEQRVSLEHYQKELADIRDEEASLPPRLADLEDTVSREKQEIDKEIIGELL